MSDIDILREEIETDPLGIEYSDMADSEVADALNALSRPGKREVPANDVRMYVLLNGLWPAIQGVAASSTNPVHKGTAITILQTLGAGSFDTIRMNNPAIAAGVAQMLQTMVDAGAMTADHRAAMVAMGATTISRAEELGLGTVHHLDVGAARQPAQEPTDGE